MPNSSKGKTSLIPRHGIVPLKPFPVLEFELTDELIEKWIGLRKYHIARTQSYKDLTESELRDFLVIEAHKLSETVAWWDIPIERYIEMRFRPSVAETGSFFRYVGTYQFSSRPSHQFAMSCIHSGRYDGKMEHAHHIGGSVCLGPEGRLFIDGLIEKGEFLEVAYELNRRLCHINFSLSSPNEQDFRKIEEVGLTREGRFVEPLASHRSGKRSR